MKKINKKDLNLKDTITCGQIFRYEIVDEKYIIIINDRVVEIYEDDDFLYLESTIEEDLESVIETYLDLDRNYDEIGKYLLSNDPELDSIIKLSKGFKIIKQPKFETIISYMISANNNVRNIQRSVNMISIKYGKKVYFKDKIYYLFPTFNELKNIKLEELKELKLGFRSEYIYELLNNINEEDLDKIDDMTTDEALKYLMNYKGIGLKIASCILLFGYNRLDVFPIDTWVKKYMSDTYNISDISKIEEFTKTKYGEYSGLVIQYMFHSKRNKGNN